MTTRLPLSFWEDERWRLEEILRPRLESIFLLGIRLSEIKLKDNASISKAVNQHAVLWARQHLDTLLTELMDTTVTGTGIIIADWLETPGATMEDLHKRLMASQMLYGKDRASRIAVTETTRAIAEGEMFNYQRLGIKKWRWNTNQDELYTIGGAHLEGVCPICLSLDGKVVEIGQPFGTNKKGQPIIKPPDAHIGDRCWVTPVVEVRKMTKHLPGQHDQKDHSPLYHGSKSGPPEKKWELGHHDAYGVYFFDNPDEAATYGEVYERVPHPGSRILQIDSSEYEELRARAKNSSGRVTAEAMRQVLNESEYDLLQTEENIFIALRPDVFQKSAASFPPAPSPLVKHLPGQHDQKDHAPKDFGESSDNYLLQDFDASTLPEEKEFKIPKSWKKHPELTSTGEYGGEVPASQVYEVEGRLDFLSEFSEASLLVGLSNGIRGKVIVAENYVPHSLVAKAAYPDTNVDEWVRLFWFRASESGDAYIMEGNVFYAGEELFGAEKPNPSKAYRNLEYAEKRLEELGLYPSDMRFRIIDDFDYSTLDKTTFSKHLSGRHDQKDHGNTSSIIPVPVDTFSTYDEMLQSYGRVDQPYFISPSGEILASSERDSHISYFPSRRWEDESAPSNSDLMEEAIDSGGLIRVRRYGSRLLIHTPRVDQETLFQLQDYYYRGILPLGNYRVEWEGKDFENIRGFPKGSIGEIAIREGKGTGIFVNSPSSIFYSGDTIALDPIEGMMLVKHMGPHDHPKGSPQIIHAHREDDETGLLPTSYLYGEGITHKGHRKKKYVDDLREYMRKERRVPGFILVQRKEDGSIHIVDGNHRVEIAHELKIEWCPVQYIADGLTKHLQGRHDQKSHGREEPEGYAPTEEEWREMSQEIGEDTFDRKDVHNKSHFYHSWAEEMRESATPAESYAIQSYIDGEYRAINGKLREMPVPPSEENLDDLIQDLDHAFESPSATCPENLIAFRGITLDPDFGKADEEAYEFYKNLSPGDVLEDRGYFSSSLSEGTANSFTAGSPAYVMFEVEVSKGASVLPASGFALVEGSLAKDERELLFERGSKFEVLEKEYDGSIDTVHASWHIKLRLKT